MLKQRVELDSKEILLETAYLDLAEYDGIDCTSKKAADAFERVAKENAFSPVVNYLDTVARQIAPIDINNLSVRYFGTSNPIYDIFLKKTLVAAVARAYEPGCKHDTTLVLQGEQGVGKSSFFDVLGGDWFDDSMGDGRTKDDLIILHKSWLQEWGEIERVFSKRQAGELKAFLARRSDTFRPPYGRSALEFPRRSIIVGSVNDCQFLVDSTGNRRYWVVPIEVPKVDLALLKQERDGIWAAAVNAYRSGESWWLNNEQENLSAENNSNYQIIDEWQSAIAIYLEHREQVSITELLLQIFNFELGKIERRDQMRVANILTNLKWKKVGQKQHQGKRQVAWIPIPSPKSPDIEKVQQPVTQLPQALSQHVCADRRLATTGDATASHPTRPSIANTETEDYQTKNISSERSIKLQKTKSTGVDNQDKKATTAWLTYPYQSKDVYTLQNRAYKVKERVLDCNNQGELITLYSQGKITAAEVDWLKNNLLGDRELNHLSQVEATEQTNLFSQDGRHERLRKPQTTRPHERKKELKVQTTKEVRRIGWGKKQGVAYIKERYGVSDRVEMSIEQLVEFRNYLRTLPGK